jgi:hypothetical protein
MNSIRGLEKARPARRSLPDSRHRIGDRQVLARATPNTATIAEISSAGLAEHAQELEGGECEQQDDAKEHQVTVFETFATDALDAVQDGVGHEIEADGDGSEIDDFQSGFLW